MAINSYGGGIQGGSGVTITNSANLTKDLSHSHPISFTYDATLEPYLGVYNADIDFISHVSDKHFDKLANGRWNS